jgi:hypothetical protein
MGGRRCQRRVGGGSAGGRSLACTGPPWEVRGSPCLSTSERPGLNGSPSWSRTVAYGVRMPSDWHGQRSSLQATRCEVRAASPPLGITPSISRQWPRRVPGSCGALGATATAPARRRAVQRHLRWCWTGGTGWGRVISDPLEQRSRDGRRRRGMMCESSRAKPASALTSHGS